MSVPGLAGSRGVADLRPATRDPGRNQRPATRDPEQPGPGPVLAGIRNVTPPGLTRRPEASQRGSQGRSPCSPLSYPAHLAVEDPPGLTRRPAVLAARAAAPAARSPILHGYAATARTPAAERRVPAPVAARGRRVQVDAELARSVYCASFIIPSEHLQLVITCLRCCCLPIGINEYQLLSCSGSKPVVHF